MDETQFNDLAEATLGKLEAALERAAETADFDIEVKPGGILELTFDDDAKIIINRHSAAREIWVAAKSGGFHFRPDGAHWVGTRDGRELFAVLSGLVSQHTGEVVELRG